MTQYLVPHHVHLCLAEDGVVFLDLKRDRYLGLGGRQMLALGAVVRGWPVQQSAQASVAGITETNVAAGIAEALAARGLLTTDEYAGRAATPVHIEPARVGLLDTELEERPRITLGQAVHLLAACALTVLNFQFRTLESLVARVQARKERYARAATHDAARIHLLVRSYLRMRLFLFTASQNCLFDSLALIEFLSRYRHFPTWVFGVRSAPFCAHCWVQDGNVVLNDTPEQVSGFTPIMAV